MSKTRKSVCVVAMKKEQSLARKHTEELRLSNDVEEMKSKLRELESLLRQVSMLFCIWLDGMEWNHSLHSITMFG